MRYIIGNWKANLDLAQVDDFYQQWQTCQPAAEALAEKTVAVAVPSIFYAYLAVKNLQPRPILQDLSIFGTNGAHTGEVTVENLKGIEPAYVIVGHSERRREFGETNEVVVNKAKTLIQAKITPIICFDLDQMKELAPMLKDLSPEAYILAYEPVEAIGSGNNLSGDLLKAHFQLIRQVFTQEARVLYGGSVKAANMYVWSSKSLLEAFEQYAPETLALCQPLLQEKSITAFNQKLTQIYPQAQAISIDYAISEKARNLLLLPGDFGWSDVGDWQVAYDLGTKDQNENVITRDGEQEPAVIACASKQNFVAETSQRLIALLGVDDLVVVDTPEILLVAKKERAQEVKKIVEQLKSENKKQYL